MMILPAISLIAALIHIVADKGKKDIGRICEILLSYFLPLTIGLGGLMAFYGHAFMADKIALSIGWPAGSPFQFEVAVANLAFGVLGILCIWFRKGFWLATGIGTSVFYFGAAFIHIREIFVKGNMAVNNTGFILWFNDLALPIFILALLLIYSMRQKHN